MLSCCRTASDPTAVYNSVDHVGTRGDEIRKLSTKYYLNLEGRSIYHLRLKLFLFFSEDTPKLDLTNQVTSINLEHPPFTPKNQTFLFPPICKAHHFYPHFPIAFETFCASELRSKLGKSSYERSFCTSLNTTSNINHTHYHIRNICERKEDDVEAT